jgi:hypothetical protein
MARLASPPGRRRDPAEQVVLRTGGEDRRSQGGDGRERAGPPGDVPLLDREAAQNRDFGLNSIAIVEDVGGDTTTQLIAVVATRQRRRSHRGKTGGLGYRPVLDGVQEDEIGRVERRAVDAHIPASGILREEDDVGAIGFAQRERDTVEALLPVCLAETPVGIASGARLQSTVECRTVGVEDRRQRERREVGRGRDVHRAHRILVASDMTRRLPPDSWAQALDAATTLISDVRAFYPACSLKSPHP